MQLKRSAKLLTVTGLTTKHAVPACVMLYLMSALVFVFLSRYNNNNNTIMVTLFQEDSIFGTNASLTYGPQIQK